MTKLHTLRARLAALRRRRWWLRVGTAACGLALAVLWTLAGLFLIDWQLELDKPQRVLVFIAGAGTVIWGWRRYVQPWLGHRETLLDMALLVERQQRIDTDLVAALQFESPEAARWGSPQLEHAVIDYVAEFGQELNVFEGLSARPLSRRAVALSATLLAIGLATVLYPGHALAFLDRLALGSQHYPTRTRIDRVVLNGQQVFPDCACLGEYRSAYWEPLKFEVHCRGEIPADGTAELRTQRSGAESTVLLTADPHREGVLVGQLDRLIDSVAYQLYVGDAWTDPAQVQVIPLPVVDIELQVTPPRYAGSGKPAEGQLGARQISVIEGSWVALLARSDKPLSQAVLTVGAQQYPLVRDGGRVTRTSLGSETKAAGYEHWKLDPKGTPLERILEPLRYQLQVTDRDGLGLKDPIEGYIRIRADRPPRVTAGLITEYVLPEATPSVTYGATDDYGVARLRLHQQVVRQEGATEELSLDVPLEGPQKVLRGKLPLELGSLRLSKGDQLKITFEAVDYRGSIKGQAALSEPLILHVTDQRGVLAAMVEADERSARQLDAIIQRQLGIGESQ